MKVVLPILVTKVVEYLQGSAGDVTMAYVYASLIVVLNCLSTIPAGYSYHLSSITSMKARAAASSLVFKKVRNVNYIILLCAIMLQNYAIVMTQRVHLVASMKPGLQQETYGQINGEWFVWILFQMMTLRPNSLAKTTSGNILNLLSTDVEQIYLVNIITSLPTNGWP